jgi:hypothetical protein
MYPRRSIAILLVAIGIIYLVMGGVRYLTGDGLLTWDGAPIAPDFLQYYVASEFLHDGRPEAAYVPEHLFAAERAIVGPTIPNGHFTYPPTYFFMLAPLALLPYLGALWVWIAVGVAFLAVALAWFGHRGKAWPWFLFCPAVSINLFAGQNGSISAALLIGALAVIQTQPVIAGILIGLLSFKPHLGIAVVVALVAGGHWRTIGAATATVMVLVLASVLAFGQAPWLGFFDSLGGVREGVEAGAWEWHRMRSTFAAARQLGLGVTAAWVAQAMVALAALVLLARLWFAESPWPLRAMALLLAVLLVSPYSQFYDFAILVGVFPWLLAYAVEQRPGHKATFVFALLWLAPILLVLVHQLAAINVAPLIVALAFLVVVNWARAHRHRGRSNNQM